MKSNILFLLLTITLTACVQNKSTKHIEIYPLTQEYIFKSNSIVGNKDSTYYCDYIIYNIASEDTSYIKGITKDFIQVLVKGKKNYQNFQLEFYKKSNHLDTTYREDKYHPLYEHQIDKLGIYFSSWKEGHYEEDWLFYKGGEPFPPVEITIEDIPKKDSGK